ncbi:MAG TPA: efflux RND transporter periplasmic adaptor subunit [Candidatus Brocadiia bacterium]|nr:efflux RND transporter periplasmic adaptor subunit [Candidatus Brocadiia bacterium]
MRKIIVIVVVLGILGVGGYYFLRGPVETVEVTAVTRGDIVVMLAEDGTVRADGEADLCFKVPGRVAEVLVHEGQEVKKGDVLCTLSCEELKAMSQQAQAAMAVARAAYDKLKAGVRPEQLEQARAELRAADTMVKQMETGVRMAETDLQRAKALYDSGVLSQDAYDRIVATFDGAKLGYEAAKQRLEGAGQAVKLLEAGAQKEDFAMAAANILQTEAAVELARVNLSNTTLTAPINGIITKVLVEPGEISAPPLPAIGIVDLATIRVELKIDQADIGDVKVGQEVLITADAFPDAEFKGEIKTILPQAEPKRQMGGMSVSLEDEDLIFRARVSVENHEGKLRPGMKIDGRVVIGIKKDVVLMPRQCAFIENGKWYVWVVEKNKLRKREVERGRQDYINVEVVKGLTQGEAVVKFRKATYEEGMRVNVQP